MFIGLLLIAFIPVITKIPLPKNSWRINFTWVESEFLEKQIQNNILLSVLVLKKSHYLTEPFDKVMVSDGFCFKFNFQMQGLVMTIH